MFFVLIFSIPHFLNLWKYTRKTCLCLQNDLEFCNYILALWPKVQSTPILKVYNICACTTENCLLTHTIYKFPGNINWKLYQRIPFDKSGLQMMSRMWSHDFSWKYFLFFATFQLKCHPPHKLRSWSFA